MAKQKTANIDSRSRNVSLLLYPDNLSHAVVLQKILMNDPDLFDSGTCWEYIGIQHRALHDDEGGTKNHYHVYLVFENPMHIKSICRRFNFFDDLGVPDDQFVRCITGRKGLENSILYLTHLNKPEKEQYSSSDLIGSSRLRAMYDLAALNYITKQSDKRDIFSEVRAWIAAQNGIITSFQMVDYLTQHRAFLIRNEPWLKSMWREHNSSLIMRYNKEIKEAISQSAEGWANILGHDLEECSIPDYGSIMDVLGNL